MQEATQKYSIFWQIFEKDSDVAKQFKAPLDISLPYFVGTEDSLRLERKERVNVNEYNLLVGLLVEYFTPPPLTVAHKIRPYFKDILLDLLERFRAQHGYDSIEQCIMVISANLREENGDAVSHRVLRAGLEIVPNSSKLRNMSSQNH